MAYLFDQVRRLVFPKANVERGPDSDGELTRLLGAIDNLPEDPRKVELDRLFGAIATIDTGEIKLDAKQQSRLSVIKAFLAKHGWPSAAG